MTFRPISHGVYTTVVLVTLCGAKQEMSWYGLPPLEIRVPIPRKRTFDTCESLADAGPRIRRFGQLDNNPSLGKWYFEEIPE